MCSKDNKETNKSNIEEVAQKERDETKYEEERNLDTEGNPAHPSLLEKLKKRNSKTKKESKARG